jgi:OOP family OmpA-OmpF porin
VLLRVALGQADALPEWRDITQGVASALVVTESLRTFDPALTLEVQGHTDNVGTDAYNQTLSQARAMAGVTWLTQHGIVASRLFAKGYGKTRPIADIGSDEGRAKNRRVVVTDRRCVAKGK